MKTPSTRKSALLVWLSLPLSLALGVTPALAGTAAAAEKATVGVALPRAKFGECYPGQLSESLRQSVITHLRRPALDVVALDSTSPEQLDAEAKGKRCAYILYTNVEQKHGSGAGGLFRKLGPLAGALPFGALAGRASGGGLTWAAEQMAQSAAATAANASEQQTLTQMVGAQQASIKRGDAISLEYRLMAVGNSAPVKADTLQAKADSDGQDVLSPMVTQLAGAVAATTTGARSDGAQGAAGSLAATPSSAAAAAGASAEQTGNAHASAFGGLFGRKSPAAKQTAPGAPDCAQIASMPNAPMTFEACQKMLASQQAYNSALTDPSASRPGDEQMNCDQILTELRQQQYSAPDKSKVAAAQAATHEEQEINAKQTAEAAKTAAREQAEVDAASAVDRATELASAGLVQGRALYATEKKHDVENAAQQERMLKERNPTDQKLGSTTAELGTDMSAQLSANPRLARLVQLADTHHCKGR